MRHSLILTIAIIAASCTPRGGQSGAFTQPSVISPVPIPTDFVWSSAAQLGAWANNPASRGSQVLLDGEDPFIRIRVGSGSFALRSPDLPADAPLIKGVRIVYRWQPTEAPHPLNVFLVIAVPWQKAYEGDQAFLALGLDAQSWTAQSAGPISSPGLPFVAQYVYFTAEASVTPGILDIRTIELTR